MAQHLLVWRSHNEFEIDVVKEWPEPVRVKVRPIVTKYYFGVTVGLFYRDSQGYGHWRSSSVCDLITAWRVAQLLPQLKTLSTSSSDDTITCLVRVMNGNSHPDNISRLARDFQMNPKDLENELVQLRLTWPTAELLYSMWKKVSTRDQNQIVHTVQQAMNEGKVTYHDGLVRLIEQSQDKLIAAAERRDHEDQLIETGIEDPSKSIGQFMRDIGVSNLVYTTGCGDIGEPSHYAMNDLDREIMKELIGHWGCARRVLLLTSAKNPDDPTAHHVSGGGGITMYSSDFGKCIHPVIMLDGEPRRLIYVVWDHGIEGFVLCLRPIGLDEEDEREDVRVSLHGLRQIAGIEVGTPPAPKLQTDATAPFVEDDVKYRAALKQHGLFRRLWIHWFGA